MTDDEYRKYGQLPPGVILTEMEKLEATQEIPEIGDCEEPSDPELVRRRCKDWRAGFFIMAALALGACVLAYVSLVNPTLCMPAPASDQHGAVMQLDPEEIRAGRESVWL